MSEPGRRAAFHSLRLTFGTNLVLSGAHPRVVQELMRHSDIRLTMKLYTDVSKLPIREAVAVLPWFEGGTKVTTSQESGSLLMVNH